MKNKNLFLKLLEAWEVQEQGMSRFGVLWEPTSWFIDGKLRVSDKKQSKRSTPSLIMQSEQLNKDA